jgi:hypothetical protein
MMTNVNEIADKIIEIVQMDGCIDNVEMLLDQYVERGASRTDTIVALELAQKNFRATALVGYANALQWQILVQHLFDCNSNWLNTWLNTLAESRPDAAMALAVAMSEHARNRRKQPVEVSKNA